MSKNFSAPRSAPKPASVSTISPSERPSLVATIELQPCAMLPNGPPWTSAGPPSSVCTRLGRIASLSSSVMAPDALSSAAVTGFRSRVSPTMIRPSRASRSVRSVASARIAMISLPGTMTNRSSRTGPALMPPRLMTIERSARSFMSMVRGQVIRRGSMPSALPWCRWLSSIADEQVVRRGDGVEVAGEVQVDLVHRHDLGVAAARRAALHAEHRAQRLGSRMHTTTFLPRRRSAWLTPTVTVLFPSPAGVGLMPVTSTSRPFGVPLGDGFGADLRLVAAVRQDLVGAEADLGRHLGDRAQLGGLRDGDVGRHGRHGASALRIRVGEVRTRARRSPPVRAISSSGGEAPHRRDPLRHLPDEGRLVPLARDGAPGRGRARRSPGAAGRAACPGSPGPAASS